MEIEPMTLPLFEPCCSVWATGRLLMLMTQKYHTFRKVHVCSFWTFLVTYIVIMMLIE